MEVSGELHALTTLPLEKEFPVAIGEEAGQDIMSCSP
jgi:hypothetical protein